MGKRKVPIVKMYHVRYVADLLVPATNTKEAFARADEEMIKMVEGDKYELDDIFTITIESEQFHIFGEPDDDDEDEEDGADEDEDSEDEDDSDEDSEDDDTEEDEE